jgi:8-oxo-dGTP pyrophosphatase MutT (NUDIX family)
VRHPTDEPEVVRALPVPFRRCIYRFAYQGMRVWWFVFRPEVMGVKCVLSDGNRILLVRHTYGPRGWDLPGGTVKPGEDPADTARREIEEELGVRVEDWTYLGEIDHMLDHRQDHLHCFAAEIHRPELSLDLGEIRSARWFPAAELPARLNYYVRPILAHARADGGPPSA